eukprot:441832-Prorocentrum_lima.AAC.1
MEEMQEVLKNTITTLQQRGAFQQQNLQQTGQAVQQGLGGSTVDQDDTPAPHPPQQQARLPGGRYVPVQPEAQESGQGYSVPEAWQAQEQEQELL